MAKLESNITNMIASLVMITGLAGAALAGIYSLTKEPIAASEKTKQIEAIKEVVPEFDNSPLDESYKAPTGDGDSLLIFPAKRYGYFVGAAVESNSKKGFSGLIRIMVGFDVDGAIRNYVVLQHAETPGLGSKMQEWFSDKNRPGQYIIGRNAEEGLKVRKDGGDVDAITAATISSRAFMDAINRAYSAYTSNQNKTDGNSSASNHKDEGGQK